MVVDIGGTVVGDDGRTACVVPGAAIVAVVVVTEVVVAGFGAVEGMA